MIENYKDHAANERTYLAWVRTGITVMVLGLFVEKFDFFLHKMTTLLNAQPIVSESKRDYELASVFLVGFGVYIIASAVFRFVRVNRAIDRREMIAFGGLLGPIITSVILLVFGSLLILSLFQLI